MHERKINNVILIFVLVINVYGYSTVEYDSPHSHTVVKTRNVTEPKQFINFQILKNPHHLLVGRCLPEHKKYHAESIVVNNDGKSQVSANIQVNVEGPVAITCVKVLDQIPNGEGGFPSYISGGVGFNYIQFGVATGYGKGFNFYVEIYGVESKT